MHRPPFWTPAAVYHWATSIDSLGSPLSDIPGSGSTPARRLSGQLDEVAKAHALSAIKKLPFECQWFGDYMYGPGGQAEEDIIHSLVRARTLQEINIQFPKTRAAKLIKIDPLARIAIRHYKDAVSPMLENQTCRSLSIRPKECKAEMERLGHGMELDNWNREWRAFWQLTMDQVQAMDAPLQTALQDWINEQRAANRHEECA